MHKVEISSQRSRIYIQKWLPVVKIQAIPGRESNFRMIEALPLLEECQIIWTRSQIRFLWPHL